MDPGSRSRPRLLNGRGPGVGTAEVDEFLVTLQVAAGF